MEKKYEKQQIIEVFVEKLSFGGAGIARIDDLVVFVHASAPKERVKAKITKVKKSFLEAQCIEVLEPSPYRREAECKIADKCGGCQWQHIEYSEQLNQKLQILTEKVHKSKLINYNSPIKIIESEEFRYRNRIQVRLDKNKLGFFQKATNSIVPTDDCLITEKAITNEFPKLKKQNSKKLQKFEIYRDLSNNIQVIKDRAHGSSQGFSQVNEKQNNKMIEWLKECINDSQYPLILDFYCGNGNLSLPLAKHHTDINFIGVELNENAVAKANTQSESLSNIQFQANDISKWLKENPIDSNSLVIIDPPRVGAEASVIQSIHESGINELIYISCNPSTWVRDVELMMELDSNWQAQDVTALDMFPQTYHVEVLSHFKRS